MILIIQRILLAAVFPLLIIDCIQTSRIQKHIRERNGDAVLRENRRLAAVSTAIVICFAGSQLLGECIDHPDHPLWAIMLKVSCAAGIPAIVSASAFHAFERKGNEIKKDGS